VTRLERNAADGLFCTAIVIDYAGGGCYPVAMQSLSCESVVIGSMDYGESDKIVTLFTLEHGKLRGIARGAKKSVRRFGGSLELFARLKLQITLTEGLARIQGADIVTVFPGIRADLGKIACAGYACDLTDALLPEGLSNPRLFRLLGAYLDHLDHSPADSSDRRFFEINLLNVLGYRPLLEECAQCAVPLSGGAWFSFATAASGLLCGRCGRGGKPVGAVTVNLLIRTLRTGKFGVTPFAPAELEEAGALLDSAIAAHLQRPLKSLAFLREIEVSAS